ncbi:unnamed protein product, partial [Prorocentrum cordatum]
RLNNCSSTCAFETVASCQHSKIPGQARFNPDALPRGPSLASQPPVAVEKVEAITGHLESAAGPRSSRRRDAARRVVARRRGRLGAKDTSLAPKKGPGPLDTRGEEEEEEEEEWGNKGGYITRCMII